MAFRFPTADHRTYKYFDVSYLTERLHLSNIASLPEFSRAILGGRKAAWNGACGSVPLLCMRGNDDRVLILVGPRGGWKQIWNFGNGHPRL